MEINKQHKAIRVAVFGTLGQADQAVLGLMQAGFGKDQISVLCSDKFTEAHFREFEHQHVAGTYTPAAAAAGGTIGALLGGLTAVAGFVATGGIGLLAAGGLAAWSGGIAGGLIGAMLTRGVERELADFYDQEVTRGKILVAVEEAKNHLDPPLDAAEEIFQHAGAEPMELTPS
jgi:hypothetical protein